MEKLENQNTKDTETSKPKEVKQSCMTKFFKRIDGKPDHEYLFQKLEADRLAAIQREKDRIKALVKAEKRRMREEELEQLRKTKEQREDEYRKRERERRARLEGAKILDNLYLGGRMAAQNYEWLTEKVPNMKYILNVTSETSCYYEKEATFVYKRIPVEDAPTEEIHKHFDEAADFIHNAIQEGNAVLVHCREGKSRSVSAIIGYLMKKLGYSLKDAFNHMITITPWELNINYGFKAQLMNLELRNQGKEELSIDFFDKSTRRGGRTINYSEIEQKQTRRRRAKPGADDGQKTKQMLSFEAYWRIFTREKNGEVVNVTALEDGMVEEVKKDGEEEKEKTEAETEKKESEGKTETVIEDVKEETKVEEIKDAQKDEKEEKEAKIPEAKEDADAEMKEVPEVNGTKVDEEVKEKTEETAKKEVNDAQRGKKRKREDKAEPPSKEDKENTSKPSTPKKAPLAKSPKKKARKDAIVTGKASILSYFNKG